MSNFAVKLSRPGCAALLLFFCSGCIPTLDKTPRIGGSVFAGVPQLPVASANVELQKASGEVIAASVTASNGTFQIPQKRFWRVIPLLGDVRPIERRMVIEANGYSTYTTFVWEHSTNVVVHLDRRGL